jgi:hypothetical protein
LSSVQVFISYAHEDKEKARRLYSELRNAGVNPWFDEDSLSPGERWESEIRKGIKNSRYFIPLLSRNSVMKKGYVQKELKSALDILDEIRESDIYIMPVRLDEIEVSDLPRKLAHIHIEDLFPDWNRGVEKILKAIKTGGPPLSPATKYRMRASQIGLGIIAMIFTIFVLSISWERLRVPIYIHLIHISPPTMTFDVFIYEIFLALAILGIERLITGIFGAGKGRSIILSLGVIVLMVAGAETLFIFSSLAYGNFLRLFAIAFSIDGAGRIYFGKRNKTTSRWSRILGIVTGIIEIILAIFIIVSLYTHSNVWIYRPVPNVPGSLSLGFGAPLAFATIAAVTVLTVGVQMMAAGIAGRRLTITI